tara:strand:- start:177 stop:1031 length:855 start_codon:yes stop_codon:yes gene_type:complete
MSRNKQRTAAATNPTAATPAVEKPPASPGTLSYVAPTEFVELPSKGKLYPPDHPLHNEEVLELRYMTAKDEDILTSPALLRNGLALERLLQNIIVDKSIDPATLLVGDRNALLVAARVSGYGEDYEINVNCPACGASSDYTFDLSGIAHTGILPEENDDVKLTENGTFVATLPKTKFPVEFRLLAGHDEVYLNKAAEQLKKLNLPDATATNLLKRVIISVNGVNVPAEINNFVDNMPALDARFLRGCIQTVTPNINMNQNFDCSSCGTVTEMEVPFTVQFFWPQ